MKKILLVDDHEIVRSGVRNVLTQLFAPCEVMEAGHETAARQHLQSQTFDLAIMDVQMPDTDSLKLTAEIKQHYPGTKVLIFSMGAEHVYAKRFLQAGAMGFVSKNAGLDELCKAIGLVLNNRRYISQSLAEELAMDINVRESCNPFELLSTREFEIASLLMQGKSVSEIATDLSLGVSTVGTYKARLFEKLNVKNVIELIELGRMMGVRE